VKGRDGGWGTLGAGKRWSVTTKNEPLEVCPVCGRTVERCQRLLAHLNTGNITLEEFAYNVAIDLLRGCVNCVWGFLSSMPDGTATRFNEYLHSVCESEGYMPFVSPFVINFLCEQEIASKKQAIEPKVVELCRLTQARAAGGL